MRSDESAELGPEDLQDSGWDEAIVLANGPETYDIANAFYAAADAARARGELRKADALRLLADVSSFQLRADQPLHPFLPWVAAGAFTSPSPDSVTREEVEALRGFTPGVAHTWMRARLADFVWVYGRGFPMACLAVASYLELAGDLDGTNPRSFTPMRALERAAELAARLGPKTQPFQDVAAHVRRLIDRVGVTDTGMQALRLSTLALRFRLDDPARLHRLAVETAERSEELADWHRAERYWLLAEDLALGAQDDEGRREALRRVAETYVQRATEIADRPHIGKITAASHLQRAVEALRRAGGMQVRVEELMRLMMEYQRDIPGALIPYSYEIPLGDFVEQAEKAVAGKEIHSALLAFAFFPTVPRYADLKQHAEEAAEKYVFKKFFPAVQHNREGRVIGRQGSTSSADPNEREAALRVDMIQHAMTIHQVMVRGAILPSRRVIVEEHPLQVEDFFWVVANNPLVPAGREMLYAEAFHAGFTGDMPKAIHILVHQVEHSIRELLRRHGVMVTGLSNDGIQMERNLNTLLIDPELVDLLGEDVVFALQSLLVEKFGPNLRNEVAHGLMAYADFLSDACHYFWWLCFRLVSMPILEAVSARESSGAESTPHDP